MECAVVPVPLDRADLVAGNINLAVQRVAASGPRLGTIVLLAGGPGEPGLPAFEDALAPLHALPGLRGYELVGFDQRGTGESGALQCPVLRRDDSVSTYFARCGTALGARRADYTSQESVEDLEAVREAVGTSQLSLFAVSYGARVAGMFAREYPQRIARMVLDSPTPLTGTDPLALRRLKALPRVLNEGICGAGACSSFTRDSYGDLTRVLAILHRHPLTARIFDDRGRLNRATISERSVEQLLALSDLSSALRGGVPAALAAAANGDPAPLVRLAGRASSSESAAVSTDLHSGAIGAAEASETTESSSISVALFEATACVESPLPWPSDSDPSSRAGLLASWLAHLPTGATAPFRARSIALTGAIASCIDWPATPPAPPPPLGLSSTPTLILSGDDDLRTPYEQDLQIASEYSQVQLLRVPGAGHSTVTTDRTGCARAAMIAFLATGAAPSVCAPPKTAQVRTLPPGSLVKVQTGTAQNTLAEKGARAVALTIEDIAGQPNESGGGLRGGSWQENSRRLSFRATIDVPGVALGGALEVRGQMLVGHLVISGRVRGRLVLHGETLSGELNQQHVRVHVSI